MKEEDIKFELLKIEFEKSFELRNIELANFWKRGWFFGALLLAIAAGYFQLGDHTDTQFFCVYIAFLGLLVAIFQSLMNRGSKSWQERADHFTRNRESALGICLINARYETQYEKDKKSSNEEKFLDETELLDICTLAKNENALTVSRKYSVSKLAILVWDIVAIYWLALWLKDLILIIFPNLIITHVVYIFHGIIALYIFFFFCLKGKPIDADKKWFPYFKKDGGKVFFGFSECNYSAEELDEIRRAYFENNVTKLKKFRFKRRRGVTNLKLPHQFQPIQGSRRKPKNT